MVSVPDYDLLFEYRWDVVRDVRTRVINSSLLTSLAVNSPVSRVIVQAVPPLQMKAHWAEPELEIVGDVLKVSADVSGGVRHVPKGINLTMKGRVGAECQPLVALTDDGLPVATLAAPSALELDLADLELSYEGDDEALSWADQAVEQTLLRPTLCGLLIAPLAGLPLNYVPVSLPPLARDDGPTRTDWSALFDPDVETLTLATSGRSARPAPAASSGGAAWAYQSGLLPDLLPEGDIANVAVAVSEPGLNGMLGHLCDRGLAAGTAYLLTGAVPWRWVAVAATLTDTGARLTGRLVFGE